MLSTDRLVRKMFTKWLARRATRDEGFSLIDVSVAMAVFAIVGVMLAGSLSNGMRGVLTGKRREVATQEVNRMLETARSLSYGAVGLIQSDATVASDTAVQTQGGVQKYLVASTWEPVVWATSAPSHPFNPHKTTVTRGATTLTRYVYVTGVDSNNDGTIDMKRVLVRVTWDSATAGNNEVRAQTFVTPNGATTFQGLMPQKADAKSTGATATVANGHGNLVGLLDAVLPTTPVSVSLPTSTGSTVYQAVSTVNCTGQSTALSGVGNDYGGHTVTVTADDDGETAAPSQPAAVSWSGNPPDGITGLDDVDGLLVESSIASPVSCTATAQDQDGVPPTDDSLPYEKGTGSGPGSLNLTTDLTGAGLPSNTLTALSIAPQPISQEIDHMMTSGVREVGVSANNGLGLVNILKIPGVFADGLVRIDAMNFGASVRSTEGATPSQAPIVTAPNPLAIRIYDPSSALVGCSSRSGGYCIYNLNPLAGGWTGLNAHVATSVNVGIAKLSFDTQVTALAPATDTVNGTTGATGERRWSATYSPVSVTSHLTVEVTIPITGAKVILTDTVISFDLGTVAATACAGVTC